MSEGEVKDPMELPAPPPVSPRRTATEIATKRKAALARRAGKRAIAQQGGGAGVAGVPASTPVEGM
jgi:hypothetical protein